MAKEPKETKPEVDEAPEVTEAHVYSGDGQLVRTFSKKIHGDDFEALAKQFAEPRAHTVKAL